MRKITCGQIKKWRRSEDLALADIIVILFIIYFHSVVSLLTLRVIDVYYVSVLVLRYLNKFLLSWTRNCVLVLQGLLDGLLF